MIPNPAFKSSSWGQGFRVRGFGEVVGLWSFNLGFGVSRFWLQGSRVGLKVRRTNADE